MFGHPVLDQYNQLARVLYVALDLKVISDVLTKQALPAEGEISLLDQEWKRFGSRSNPKIWVGHNRRSSGLFTAMRTKREGTVQTEGWDGISRLYAFTTIPNGNQTALYLTVGIPASYAYGASRRILARNLMILGVVALLTLTAAWLSGQYSILKPVQTLVSATHQLAGGNLNARTGLKGGSGELSQLGRAFDEMASSLQRQQLATEQSQKALRSSEERLRLVLRTALDAIFTLDSGGRIVGVQSSGRKDLRLA